MKAKKQFAIEVRTAWCKACQICVTFCPVHVLEMKAGVAAAIRPESCIGCQDCVLRCPDFAIEVFEKKTEEEPQAAQAEAQNEEASS